MSEAKRWRFVAVAAALGLTFLLAAVAAIVSTAEAQSQQQDSGSSIPGYGVASNNTGNPIGGGNGYTKTVQQEDAEHVVENKGQLFDALEEVEEGEAIFVADDINLTGEEKIEIPGGVTLAGDRGQNDSPGARLFTKEMSFDNYDKAFLFVAGDGVRITGLNIEGPYKGTDKLGSWHKNLRGIDAEDTETGQGYRVEVDNNEISGWAHSGVMLDRGSVHHNSIHDNQQDSLGYGVAVNPNEDADENVKIVANSFNSNRHSIKGKGAPDVRYEAYFNRIGPDRIGHAIDLHEERCKTNDEGEYYSGEYVHIHHNTVAAGPKPSWEAVGIRGNPYEESLIEKNWFKGEKNPVTQKNGDENLVSRDNRVGPSGDHEVVPDGPLHRWEGDVAACE